VEKSRNQSWPPGTVEVKPNLFQNCRFTGAWQPKINPGKDSIMDLDFSLFVRIFSSWQVIFITIIILVLFPVIFYVASFGKAPAQFRKKTAKKPASRVMPAKTEKKELPHDRRAPTVILGDEDEEPADSQNTV
jgi:hypothetical protein